MTPKQFTTIDTKELKQLEIACSCGATTTLQIPLKNELVDETVCLGCKSPMW